MSLAKLCLRISLTLGLLLGLGLALGPGCDKGERECDVRHACEDGLLCDIGSNQCYDPSEGKCTVKADCTDPTKANCRVDTGVCVACINMGSTAECGYAGVCDVKSTCLGCQVDADCHEDDVTDDTVCLRSGGCAKQVDVAYVSATGTDNAECTFAAPCTTLEKAVATGRSTIRVRGAVTLAAALVLAPAAKLSIYGSKATRNVISRTGDGELLQISGAGTVELRDLELSGATGATGHGILVTSGTPVLDLDDVDVLGNAGVGISAGMSKLTVTHSVIADNDGGGIGASGIVFLENNVIAANGSATSAGGGVTLASTAAENIVRFNTFAANLAAAGTARSISCGDAAVTPSSNIFAGTAPQVTTCTTSYSLYPAGTAVTGTGDLAGDPLFGTTTLPSAANRSPDRIDLRYYDILAGSPAIDKGQAGEIGGGSGVINDINGDSRAGALRDIGADEFSE